jgi:lipoate-protein ligase A
MKKWRFVISEPGTGPGNMALDEAMLDALSEKLVESPTFRLYSWQAPCVTIGYFQKHACYSGEQLPVTRRLTGGLSVSHGMDISYAFTAGKDDWPYLYNQEKTYEHLHAGIKAGLDLLGHKSAFYRDAVRTSGAGAGVCVNTFYPFDLHIGGRKVLGSSQRRRGSALLQQGSIHIRFERNYVDVADALMHGLEKKLGISFALQNVNENELAAARKLMEMKYATDEWNNKY